MSLIDDIEQQSFVTGNETPSTSLFGNPVDKTVAEVTTPIVRHQREKENVEPSSPVIDVVLKSGDDTKRHRILVRNQIRQEKL